MDESESSSEKVQRKEVYLMDVSERYGWKMGRMMEVIERLVRQVNENTEKLDLSNREHENQINEAFRRIDSRV